jgi:hypothetical protein
MGTPRRIRPHRGIELPLDPAKPATPGEHKGRAVNTRLPGDDGNRLMRKWG